MQAGFGLVIVKPSCIKHYPNCATARATVDLNTFRSLCSFANCLFFLLLHKQKKFSTCAVSVFLINNIEARCFILDYKKVQFKTLRKFGENITTMCHPQNVFVHHSHDKNKKKSFHCETISCYVKNYWLHGCFQPCHCRCGLCGDAGKAD